MAGWKRVNGIKDGKKSSQNIMTPEKIEKLKALANMHRELERKQNGKT